MGKISNITNSSDPQSVNSRIFVGNLNTFVLLKEDVRSIFERYGEVIGISMHKGYAFIQYRNEDIARHAVAAEDQRFYAGQQIDANMSSEPKPDRPSRKRPLGAGNEWDYYYNVPVLPSLPAVLNLKRPCPEISFHSAPPLKNLSLGNTVSLFDGRRPGQFASRAFPTRRTIAAKHRPTSVTKHPAKFETSESTSTDIVICGNCKERFEDPEQLIDHKRARCRLRFRCKCRPSSDDHVTTEHLPDEPEAFHCASCKSTFHTCWELCYHCQTQHKLTLYTDQHQNNDTDSTGSSQNENVPDPRSGTAGDVADISDESDDQLSPNGIVHVNGNTRHTQTLVQMEATEAALNTTL